MSTPDESPLLGCTVASRQHRWERIFCDFPWPARCVWCDLRTTDPDGVFDGPFDEDDPIPNSRRCATSPTGMHVIDPWAMCRNGCGAKKRHLGGDRWEEVR